jgi:hypothetical protein
VDQVENQYLSSRTRSGLCRDARPAPARPRGTQEMPVEGDMPFSQVLDPV